MKSAGGAALARAYGKPCRPAQPLVPGLMSAALRLRGLRVVRGAVDKAQPPPAESPGVALARAGLLSGYRAGTVRPAALRLRGPTVSL
jgi:hypothetical protein